RHDRRAGARDRRPARVPRRAGGPAVGRKALPPPGVRRRGHHRHHARVLGRMGLRGRGRGAGRRGAVTEDRHGPRVHLLATSVTPSRSSTRLGLHVAGLLGQAGIEVTVSDMGEAPERWLAHPGAHLAHYAGAFLELAAEVAAADALIVAASVYS